MPSGLTRLLGTTEAILFPVANVKATGTHIRFCYITHSNHLHSGSSIILNQDSTHCYNLKLKTICALFHYLTLLYQTLICI
jgi:hypothetical protein